MIADKKTVAELKQAYEDILTLQEKAIRRARLWLAAGNPPSPYLRGENGYTVRVPIAPLLDESAKYVIFIGLDAKGEIVTPGAYRVPRDFIFMEETPEEAPDPEYLEYQRLHAKFGNKHSL